MICFSPFTAGRYHSLVIEKETFPHDALEITAWTEDGLVMAARHKVYKHLQVNPVQLSYFIDRRIVCISNFPTSVSHATPCSVTMKRLSINFVHPITLYSCVD